MARHLYTSRARLSSPSDSPHPGFSAVFRSPSTVAVSRRPPRHRRLTSQRPHNTEWDRNTGCGFHGIENGDKYAATTSAQKKWRIEKWQKMMHTVIDMWIINIFKNFTYTSHIQYNASSNQNSSIHFCSVTATNDCAADRGSSLSFRPLFQNSDPSVW